MDSKITTTDAFLEFKKAWDSVYDEALTRAKDNEKETSDLFLVYDDRNQGFNAKLDGPIRIHVWRMIKKGKPSPTQERELSMRNNEAGKRMLDQQETFYFYDPDALFLAEQNFDISGTRKAIFLSIT